VDKKRIKKFIKKAAGEDIGFKFVFLREKDGGEFFMRALCKAQDPLIEINKYWFNNKNLFREFYDSNVSKEDAIKGSLLHEIGHIKTCKIKKNKNKLIGLNEFLAHKWAIKTAKQFKMNKIRIQLEKHIKNWGNFCWNKDKSFRRYILASKMYREEIKNG